MTSDVLLKSHLKTLKLPTILQEYARASRQCAQEDRSFEDFVLYLVELEVAERHRKACERRLKQAGFPTAKEIADFDFAAIPQLNKKRLLDLSLGHFIEKRECIVLIGPPGVGKTARTIPHRLVQLSGQSQSDYCAGCAHRVPWSRAPAGAKEHMMHRRHQDRRMTLLWLPKGRSRCPPMEGGSP